MSLSGTVRTLVISLAALCFTANAATVYVSTTGNDANDGRTWLTARRTVQAALNATAPADQVWVAAGTYVENITLSPGVSLYGGFAGTETDLAQRYWTTNVTILDGNQAASVVIAPAGADETTRIDGFTLRNGTGTPPWPGDTDGYGGGVFCVESSPTIANNTITGNLHGGIFCHNSTPIITRNSISSNSFHGILCDDSSATIVSNTISGNAGSGVFCTGYSCPTIANNTITRNTAIFIGGGVSAACGAQPTIVNNTITANVAAYGGGICCQSPATIIGNTIVGNSAEIGGGIYYNNQSGGSTVIANTIFAFNSSGLYAEQAVTLQYNCFYENLDHSRNTPPSTHGNISADPLFVSASPGPDGVWGTADDTYSDLHLLPGSPCINAGDPAFVPSIGETDVDGQPRVMADRVDIGADEFTWTGDANLDGYVDVVDLLNLVAAFGSTAGDANYNPACDFNRDSAIDVVDLMDLVSNFGN